MKKHKYTLSMLFLLGVLALGAMGCFAADDWSDALVKPGVLTVGTTGSAPPFTYYNEDNELVGFDIDVATALAADLGLVVEFVVLDWAGMLPGLPAGRFDVVCSGVTRTAARLESPDMILTQPYIVNGVVIMKKKGDDRINGWDDVCGYVMGGVRGAVQPGIAQGKLPEGCVPEFKEYPGWTEMLIDLELNRFDYAAMDFLGPNYLMLSGDYNVEVLPDSIETITQGIAVSPSNPALHAEVDQLLATYKAAHALDWLVEKWFGARLPWSLVD